VPSTKEIYQKLLKDGIIEIFSQAGCLVGNPGCAGCAAGQIGQNGPGEITISTGNRNFAGKQGKGEVYLASPRVAAASAIAGVICDLDSMPSTPAVFKANSQNKPQKASKSISQSEAPEILKGRVWFINKDNIDTDMIYHNRYLAITNIDEMGQYTFDNLKGWEDFSKKAKPGDIIFTAKNFGCGSSRQQAVDCFKSLGVSAIVANSFGAIYERNAINAAFPIITYKNSIKDLKLKNGDEIELNLETGHTKNLTSDNEIKCDPFSKVQMEIYQKHGLLS